MDDVRSNRTTDLDVQHNFRECNNYFQDSKMDVDDETFSASEMKYAETDVNDFAFWWWKVGYARFNIFRFTDTESFIVNIHFRVLKIIVTFSDVVLYI